MVDIGTLTISVEADTSRADRQLRTFQNRTQRQFNTLTSSFTRAGRTLSAALTAPLALATNQILETATSVEFLAQTAAGINQLQAPDFNIARVGEQALQFSQQAIQVARDVQFTTSEIAQAQVTLSRAGFSANTLLAEQGQLVRDVSSLAFTANLELEKAAAISARVLGAFGFTTETERLSNFQNIADVLNVTAASAATNIEELGSAITFVGPIASQLGVSVEETGAALGVLANAGFRGTLAGTGLRRVLSGLANPTGEAADIIEELGINIADAQGNFVGLQPVLAQFQEAFAGLGQTEQTAIAFTLFGQRGGPAFVNLVREASEELVSLGDRLDNAEGATRELEEALLDTAQGQFALLRSAIESFSLTVSSSGLLDFTRDVAEGLKEVIDQASVFIETRPEVVNTALAFAGGLAAIGPSLLLVGAAFDSFIPSIENILFLLPRITAAAVPFTALAGGLTLVVTESERLQTVLRDVGGSIADFLFGGGDNNIDEFVGPILNALQEVREEVSPTFRAIGDGIAEALEGVDQDSFNGLRDGLTGAIGQIPALVDVAVPAVRTIIRNIQEFIETIDDDLISLAGTFFRQGAEGLLVFSVAASELLVALAPVLERLIQFIEVVIEIADVLPGASIALNAFAGALLFRGITGRAGPLNFLSRLTAGFAAFGRRVSLTRTQVDQTAASINRLTAAQASGRVVTPERAQNIGASRAGVFGFSAPRGSVPDLDLDSRLGRLRDSVSRTLNADIIPTVDRLNARFDQIRTSTDRAQANVNRLTDSVRRFRVQAFQATSALDDFRRASTTQGPRVNPNQSFRGNLGITDDLLDRGRFRDIDSIRTVLERAEPNSAAQIAFVENLQRTVNEYDRLSRAVTTNEQALRTSQRSLIGANNILTQYQAQLRGVKGELDGLRRIPIREQFRLLNDTVKVNADNMASFAQRARLTGTQFRELSDNINRFGAVFANTQGQVVAGATRQVAAIRGIGRALRGLRVAALGLAGAFAPLLILEGAFFAFDRLSGAAAERAAEDAATFIDELQAQIGNRIDQVGPVEIESSDLIAIRPGSARQTDVFEGLFGGDFENGIRNSFDQAGVSGIVEDGIGRALRSTLPEFDDVRFNFDFDTFLGDLSDIEQQDFAIAFDIQLRDPAQAGQSIANQINSQINGLSGVEQAVAITNFLNTIDDESRRTAIGLQILTENLEGLEGADDEILRSLEGVGPALASTVSSLQNSESFFEREALRKGLEDLGLTYDEFIERLQTATPEELDGLVDSVRDIIRLTPELQAQFQQGIANTPLVQDLRDLRVVLGQDFGSIEFTIDIVTDTFDDIGDPLSRLESLRQVQDDVQSVVDTINDDIASTPQLTLDAASLQQFFDGADFTNLDFNETDLQVLGVVEGALGRTEEGIEAALGEFLSGNIGINQFNLQTAGLRNELLTALEPIFAVAPEELRTTILGQLDTAFRAADLRAGAEILLDDLNLGNLLDENEILGLFDAIALGDTQALNEFLTTFDGDLSALGDVDTTRLNELIAIVQELYGLASNAPQTPIIPQSLIDGLGGGAQATAFLEANITDFAPINQAVADQNFVSSLELEVGDSVETSLEFIRTEINELQDPSLGQLDIDADDAFVTLTAIENQLARIRANASRPVFIQGVTSLSSITGAGANGGIFSSLGRVPVPGFAQGGLPSNEGIVNFSKIRVGEAGREMVLPSPRIKAAAFRRTVEEGQASGFFGSNNPFQSEGNRTVNVTDNRQFVLQGVSGEQMMARLRAQDDADYLRYGGLV